METAGAAIPSGSQTLHVCGAFERNGYTLDVDVRASSDELLVVVGPNGAGKSTLFAIIAGLLQLTRGHLTFGEQLWDAPSQRVLVEAAQRDIGAVFQDGRLFEHLNVLANVAFGLRARGKSRSAAHASAHDVLARLQIGELADRQVGELSGGQIQVVALARALAIKPSMLLLDEPLAALDVGARAAMRVAIRVAAETIEGPTILITHDPYEALTLADRLVVLEAGRVVQSGSVAEVRRSPRSRYVAEFLGSNVFQGVCDATVFRGDDGVQFAVVGDIESGSATAVIEPRSVSLHRARPDTSARNVWEMRVVGIDDDGSGRLRVHLDGPLRLTGEVTPGAVRELALQSNDFVWVSVKATDIRVEPRA